MVGFPGGSTPDLVARTIAEPLSKALGQPVIVENRPGASGNIAADIVAKATDNHTIGVLINGNMTIAKLLNPATPFDPLKDLAPISLIGTAPLLLTAPVNAPGNTAQEFFLAARNAGNKWSYGTPGHRDRGAHRHGAAQDQDEHRPGARALPGQPAGDQRDDRRPDPAVAAAAGAGARRRCGPASSRPSA